MSAYFSRDSCTAITLTFKAKICFTNVSSAMTTLDGVCIWSPSLHSFVFVSQSHPTCPSNKVSDLPARLQIEGKVCH